MRSRIASSAALAALVTALATPAQADPTPGERVMAETLFRDAKKLLARGKVPEACEKLGASYQLDAAGGTLINLAMCHEIEGKTATAWSEFNTALTLAKSSARADRQKAAREHITALEPKLSRLTIKVPAGSELEVKLDGVAIPAGALGTSIPVDPGDHTASASAPGKRSWEAKVTIKPAEPQTLTVPPLEAPTLPPAPPPATTGGWKKPVGLVALGLGAVGLGVGTYFGVHALGLASQASLGCPDKVCTPAGWKALGDGRAAAAVANGTLIAGGVLAAAGAALVIVAAVTAPADRANAARLPLDISVGAGGAFVSTGGAF
jgi:hypothetical protein